MNPLLYAQADADEMLQPAPPAEDQIAETQQPAEGEPAPPRPGGDGLGFIFPLLIIFVVFFLLIMPQRKKEKQRREMLDKLRRGDRVVTIGGIHGEVASLTDETAILNVDSKNNATIKLSRSAISRILESGEEGKDEV